MEKSLILRGHCFGLDSIEVFRACKAVGTTDHIRRPTRPPPPSMAPYVVLPYLSTHALAGEMCNYLAMAYMQNGNADNGYFAIALELLRKAEVLTERHPVVRAVTFNNLACLFRR
jgi:hypothetical protein